MTIVDRRTNPGRKSLPNSQRFLQRAKVQVRRAVSDSIARRKIGDKGDERIKVVGSGTVEPVLHHGDGGDADFVLPGNEIFVKGDRLNRPRSGGRGSSGSEEGGGEDSFEFTLTRDEFLDLFFQDLALPDMVKAALLDESATRPKRAGFSTTGSASGLNLGRTMRKSMARRTGLGRPADNGIEKLLAAVATAVEEGDADAVSAAREALEEGLRRASRVPWIDPIDLMYNRFEPDPKPITGAVMFCLMDVSGSMTETMKDLAKRFFLLLQIFLERRYKRVEIVFIRHTEIAQEVDEDTFFHDNRSGGTIVSSALRTMVGVQRERFPASEWNIYVAQASDGDNAHSDEDAALALMIEDILPVVQYFAYIETQPVLSDRVSDLWRSYRTIGSDGVGSRLAMRKVASSAEIWGVFADLFAADRKAAA